MILRNISDKGRARNMSNNRDSKGIANHILPTSATMTGVCITVISIVRLTETTRHISTAIDNLLAMNGLIFVVSCYMSYLSMRSVRNAAAFEKYADVFFLVGLTMMAIGGFLLAWEFEHF